MDITPIGKRGFLIQFGEGDGPWTYPTNIYLIHGHEHVFVCDTHCGSRSMEPVRRFIAERMPGRKIVVFNTHSHWDHWWGNCAFESAPIVAHLSCQRTVMEQGTWAMEQHADNRNGTVQLLPPNVTFSDELRFESEGVVFQHTPGHSDDCASCIDLEDNVMFLGDLVEDPIPYLEWHRLDVYQETLRRIMSEPARLMLCSHSGVVDPSMLRRTLNYIHSVAAGLKLRFDDKAVNDLHNCNLRSLLVSRCEENARTLLGSRFDFQDFVQVVSSNTEQPLPELEKALGRFVSSHELPV